MYDERFKMVKSSKNSTCKKNFYLPVLSELKISTNLTKIQEKLSISKQQLNYYLRRLKENGLIIKKGKGWYEIVKGSKNSTKYGVLLKQDNIRGHAYVWNINLSKEIDGWNQRIEILKQKRVNFKLIGAKGTTPRIKILGRKVWLCNNHLRVFDKKDSSYYGNNAKESRYIALNEIKLIVGILNKKLGVFLKPTDITFRKEHYALIKNDLAIEENRKGNIIRISDENGEWLLIDDSLGQGGELENVGKSSYKTNIPMQKWWNNNKEHNFKVTPSFILEGFNKLSIVAGNNQELLKDVPIIMNQLQKEIKSHLSLIQEYRQENRIWRKSETKRIRNELKLGKQTTLNDFK